MNQSDHSDMVNSPGGEDLSRRLNELFEQKERTLRELMQHHGPDHVLRMFEPRKKDKFKEIKK